jgi:hypothetical protein
MSPGGSHWPSIVRGLPAVLPAEFKTPPCFRVALLWRLHNLAKIQGNGVLIRIDGAVTPLAVLDALAAASPMLFDTIRRHTT